VVPFDEGQQDDVFEPEWVPTESTESTESTEENDAAPAKKPRKAKPARKAAKRSAAPVAAPAAGAGPGRFDYDLTKLTTTPVPGVESSGFGWREDPINNRRKFHKGTDFRAPRGTAVYAAGAGVVTFAARMGGYGNIIVVDHGNGVITRYGHLRRIGTQRGAQVVAGAQIGEVGSTGRTTGSHLHFEVRLEGRAVNPSVAMALAALQRTDPVAARAAAGALAPEVQAVSSDPHSRAGKRPDRRGRAKRTKALW
jgi:murein DD-endopeptidase MepM/ murein hydrolase activator NlpD